MLYNAKAENIKLMCIFGMSETLRSIHRVY